MQLKRELIAKRSSEFRIGNQIVLDIDNFRISFDYLLLFIIWMTGADHYTEDLLYKKVDGKQSTMQVLFHKCLRLSAGHKARVLLMLEHPHMCVV